MMMQFQLEFHSFKVLYYKFLCHHNMPGQNTHPLHLEYCLHKSYPDSAKRNQLNNKLDPEFHEHII